MTAVTATALAEALGLWWQLRGWSKLISSVTVKPEDLTPENRVRAQQALANHYLTQPWP